jgi:dimethylhistidine N-methyltransferase
MSVSDTPVTSASSDFLEDVLAGLSRPQKSLPCRWFYDARGSALFEQITTQPEYYLTRTETQILREAAPKIAEAMGCEAVLIEYGAGASTKTRILLDAADALFAYVPVDVSETFLFESAAALQAEYPMFHVKPVVGNFMMPFNPPKSKGRTVAFFPGSTIGNLSDREIHQFLSNVRRTIGDNGQFIIGYDRVKPLDILLSAYDDAAGVTAAFNLNILHRMRHDLNAVINIENFEHEACWNASDSRIEMHLVSKLAQTIHVGGQRFEFQPGETIHTENSRKFTSDHMKQLCDSAGFEVLRTYSDAEALFSVSVLEPRL